MDGLRQMDVRVWRQHEQNISARHAHGVAQNARLHDRTLVQDAPLWLPCPVSQTPPGGAPALAAALTASKCRTDNTQAESTPFAVIPPHVSMGSAAVSISVPCSSPGFQVSNGLLTQRPHESESRSGTDVSVPHAHLFTYEAANGYTHNDSSKRLHFAPDWHRDASSERSAVVVKLQLALKSCEMIARRGKWVAAIQQCAEIFKDMFRLCKECNSSSPPAASRARRIALSEPSTASATDFVALAPCTKPSLDFIFSAARLVTEEKRLFHEALRLMGICQLLAKQYGQALFYLDFDLRIEERDFLSLHALGRAVHESTPAKAGIVVGILRRALTERHAFDEHVREVVASSGDCGLEGATMKHTGFLCDGLCMGTEQSIRELLATVLTDIGVKLKAAELPLDALHVYVEAVQVLPTYARAFYNIGVAHAELGVVHMALEAYERAVALSPDFAEAWCNMGVIHKAAGNIPKAVEMYERALSINSNFELAKRNLSVALSDLATLMKPNSMKQVIALYKRALSYNPGCAEIHHNLGVAYSEVCKVERAIASYQLATCLNPNYAEAHNNLGVVYKECGNYEQAIECYKAAIATNANHFQAHNNLAVVYTLLGTISLAKLHFLAALNQHPSYAEAQNNLGVLFREEGDILRAISCYDRCLELEPSNDMAAQNRLHALNYVEGLSTNDIFKEHESWGRRFQERVESELRTRANGGDEEARAVQFMRNRVLKAIRQPRRNDERRLRIGIVSADFFTHSVSYFAEVVLAELNPEKFELYVYSNVAREDTKTKRFQEFANVMPRWKRVTGMKTIPCAALILNDNIDIMIELSGHTAGNRLDVMALRVAPVQITWIGYPNTTGLSSIDYRVTDAVVDPIDTPQLFSERLYRLPRSFLCYTPMADAPEVDRTPPCVRAGGLITFGSFNILAKMQSQTVALWARVLREVPESRLMLKSKALGCETTKHRIESMFEAHGIAPYRLDLVPLVPSTSSHLDMYGMVDICLDPFPYAGTTTTCEALLMGVPVVSLCTSTSDASLLSHVQNVGLSLLTSVGHPEWVASTPDEYVSIARRLAADSSTLVAIRSSLRGDMLRSALCDRPAYMAEVQDMLLDMWAQG
ncbi:putative UDP-N-acetylglucosamine--peptide N-acetylglucosaminyltransferase [Porphyridium purpureum]|uniref:Probable UDP-N-acetylglucosamine--peptide N-acetylglucosaminyltransferase SPINDLY n=1 Tax=Porphyridium purpureum TaxID=35688 RepID=A0A5J4Z485_PORPP|nr:putative UDP-N-acetylglucosamine--peptide N-acetylglucosaminyltransferase [Porphyridium purpureum]|eukprot:POR8187..scf295_1